jgi:hypothetical protein
MGKLGDILAHPEELLPLVRGLGAAAGARAVQQSLLAGWHNS